MSVENFRLNRAAINFGAQILKSNYLVLLNSEKRTRKGKGKGSGATFVSYRAPGFVDSALPVNSLELHKSEECSLAKVEWTCISTPVQIVQLPIFGRFHSSLVPNISMWRESCFLYKVGLLQQIS